MKVLHLFSNWKFTGPADPALVLAKALDESGLSVAFAAGRTPGGDRGVAELARDRGLDVVEGLELQKHGRPMPWFHDVRTLRRWLRDGISGFGSIDLIHTHLPNDHHIASVAARRTRTPVVRSLYELEPPSGRRARTALRGTAALFPPTPLARERLATARATIPHECPVIAPVLDLDRFAGERDASVREEWGIDRDDFVVGVVARMQRHRRFPELIEGFARVARNDAKLHLVILGRGTHQVEVAHEPAAQSGVGDQIHFPGYVDPARYPQQLPAFDTQLFLVPGSDGTCRAMREAQASGVPVITSSRGLLPHLMAPEESGLLLPEDSPDAIAEAIARLREEPELQKKLAEGARAFAHRMFSAETAAAQVTKTYQAVRRR